MVSRIIKATAAVVATVSIASAASASCGAGLYCGQTASTPQPISSWTGASSSYATPSYSGSYSSASTYSEPSYSSSYAAPSYAGSSYSTSSYSQMSSYEADSTYGTGSISESYAAPMTQSFTGSPSSVSGLGYNESLQATNCPVNVHGTGEGQVIGCYNVVKPVPQTTYRRVVRPVIYVRYPVPVAVPYTSPCNTVKHYSRYGGFGANRGRRSCG